MIYLNPYQSPPNVIKEFKRKRGTTNVWIKPNDKKAFLPCVWNLLGEFGTQINKIEIDCSGGQFFYMEDHLPLLLEVLKNLKCLFSLDLCERDVYEPPFSFFLEFSAVQKSVEKNRIQLLRLLHTWIQYADIENIVFKYLSLQ